MGRHRVSRHERPTIVIPGSTRDARVGTAMSVAVAGTTMLMAQEQVAVVAVAEPIQTTPVPARIVEVPSKVDNAVELTVQSKATRRAAKKATETTETVQSVLTKAMTLDVEEE